MKEIIIKPNDVITQSKACELLDVSLTQLRRFVNEGHIRFVKDKTNLRQTLVLKSDVQSLLDSRYYIV